MTDSQNSAAQNTQIAVFEEIRRDMAASPNSSTRVPLNMVFGRGTVGNPVSFGGSSLAENAQKVDQALANVGELQAIWNHQTEAIFLIKLIINYLYI